MVTKRAKKPARKPAEKEVTAQEMLGQVVRLANAVEDLVQLHRDKLETNRMVIDRRKIGAWIMYGPARFEEAVDWNRVALAIARGDAIKWVHENPETFHEFIGVLATAIPA